MHFPLSGYVLSTTFKAIALGGWDPGEDGISIPRHNEIHSN